MQVCETALLRLACERDKVLGVMPVIALSLQERLERAPEIFNIQVAERLTAMGLVYGPVYRKDQTQLALTNQMISIKSPDANLVEGSDHLLTAQCR